jgi:hypothetical protein
VAAITEHDVPNDDQAPTVAEYLERQIDRATRANFATGLDFLHDFHHLPLAVCIESVLNLIHLHYASGLSGKMRGNEAAIGRIRCFLRRWTAGLANLSSSGFSGSANAEGDSTDHSHTH